MAWCRAKSTVLRLPGRFSTPTLATQQLGDLGCVSKVWISYLHQRDAGEVVFTILFMSEVWNSVMSYLAGL